MRIIRLAWDYPMKGSPSFGLQPSYYYLSKEQARQGYDVHVITKAEGSNEVEETFDGVSVHRVPTPFSLNAYRMIRRLGAEGSPSLIHSHATCGAFLAVARKTMGLPMVSHVHGCSRSPHMPITLRFGDSMLRYSSKENWYRYFRERALWSSADRVLAVSLSVKRDLESTYRIPPSRVDVVYNGVDTNIFRPLAGRPFPGRLRQYEGKRIVLYVGHFGLRKGVVFLIRAMKKVTAEVRDAVLVCIGGLPKWLGTRDDWAYLQRNIMENGLDGKVLLLDRIPNEELPLCYAAADVFALPSYYEAFAKVLIEAMACGKPAVVTRGGGPAEAIADGESGLLVDYGNVDQLAEGVIRVLHDEELGRRLGGNAEEVVRRKFTWTAVAERISESYRSVPVRPLAG